MYFLGLSSPMRKMSRAYAMSLFSPPQPKAQIHLQRGHFLVKIADTPHELNSVFTLRQSVFQREFEGKRFSLRSDRELFDDYADFLVIIDQRRDKVVGTYRMISGCEPHAYYSASEFDLGDFIQIPGKKLELSRACIHRNYRNGTVMQMLWRGVAAYSKAVDARYLFGCASVQTMQLAEVSQLVVDLEAQGVLSYEFNTKTLAKYTMENLQEFINKERSLRSTADSKSFRKSELPPLFKSYLKAGAKVQGLPAIDRAFRCVDFLTILDFEHINAAHEKKFLQ